MAELIIPQEAQPEPPREDPVKCETCVYFRAFTEPERDQTSTVGRLVGDGWCQADPPNISARQLPVVSGYVIEPVQRPTHRGWRCRHWRAEFAGDAGMPVAEALEAMAEDLAALVQYARESINVGRQGKA